MDDRETFRFAYVRAMSALDDQIEAEELSLREAGTFGNSRLDLARSRIRHFGDTLAAIEMTEAAQYLRAAPDRSLAVSVEIDRLRATIKGVLSGMITETQVTRTFSSADICQSAPQGQSHSSPHPNPMDPRDPNFLLWSNILNQ